MEPPPTAPLPTPVTAGNCPTGTLTVYQFSEYREFCFGSSDVTIRGWLADPPSLGFEGPPVEPAWLYYPPSFVSSALWQRGPGGDEMCGGDGGEDGSFECAWLFLHIPPDSDIVLEGPHRWVVASGHIRDPRAETCHHVYDSPMTEPTPPDVYAQETCGLQFVLTAIGDDPAAR